MAHLLLKSERTQKLNQSLTKQAKQLKKTRTRSDDQHR